PYDLIRAKQAGQVHTSEEIQFLLSAFMDGDLPDYQMSAWLMAVYFQGMSTEEYVALTDIMLNSGQRLDFSYLNGYVADKHSTGGVGDKISLILAPVVVACGVYVPMISGRGLGHTGGTLDKLESIPGFRTDLDPETFRRIVGEVGTCLVGQTDEICPADRKLYALRDVTATVSSIPLITASIMCKKIAEGIQGLVLDIKVGNGAFMTTKQAAKELAAALTETGNRFNIQTVPRLTDMNQPLGNAAGLWCEIRESLAVLEGHGPADVAELSVRLATDILQMARIDAPARAVQEAISSGRAREKLDEIVFAQGGDPAALTNPDTHLPRAVAPILSPIAGYLVGVDTYRCGMSLVTAGAGRKKLDDALDPSAGFHLDVKIGDRVGQGAEVGRVFGADKGRIEQAQRELQDALSWGEEPVPSPQLIMQ
ncbi:thymidine phosphorylase, partial [Candidatus Neomarinimicrobiota bacterium]